MHAQWLKVTAGNVRAIVLRWSDDAQTNRVGVNDELGSMLLGDLADLLCLFFEKTQVGR